jgi:hypothetical protein
MVSAGTAAAVETHMRQATKRQNKEREFMIII